MSASEKLRALIAEGKRDGHIAACQEDALPLIADVVEAAERAEAYLRQSNYLVGAEAVNEQLAPALTALQEHLERE